MNLIHTDRGDFLPAPGMSIDQGTPSMCNAYGDDQYDSDINNMRSFSRSPAGAYIQSWADKWSESRSAVSRVASNVSTVSKQLLISPTTECTGPFLLSPFQLADSSPQIMSPLRSAAASVSDTTNPVDWSLVSRVSSVSAPRIHADGTTSGYVNSIRQRVQMSRPADNCIRSISPSFTDSCDEFDLPYILSEAGVEDIPVIAHATVEAIDVSDAETCTSDEDSSSTVQSNDARLVDSITRIRHRLAPPGLPPVEYEEVSGPCGQYHYRYRRNNSIFAIGRASSPSTSSMENCGTSCTSLYGPDLTPPYRQ